MSNINSFAVTQYGSTFTSATRLLNMDGFTQVQDNGNSTTLVMYNPVYGVEYLVPVVINESFASVNAKLAAKTAAGSANLYIISQGATTLNQSITLESRYFLMAQAAPNPTHSILMYQPPSGEMLKYVVGGDLSYILARIDVPIAPVIMDGGTIAITTSPQDITMNEDFGSSGGYIVTSAFMANGGGIVDSVTNISGTVFRVTVTAVGDMNWSAQSI